MFVRISNQINTLVEETKKNRDSKSQVPSDTESNEHCINYVVIYQLS